MALISEDVSSTECVQWAEVLAAEADRTPAQDDQRLRQRIKIAVVSSLVPILLPVERARARASSKEKRRIHRVSSVAEVIISGDVCGFVKPPNSYDKWTVRVHGACTIRETLGLRPRDQSCHHEVWLEMDLVGNQCAHAPRGHHEQRVLLKERSCHCPA